jgi:hypothetical protein
MSAREVIARALCRSRCENRAHPCDQDNTGACLPEACRLWDVLWGDGADAILAALDAAPEAVRLELARRLAGEAWRVVPVEPTEAMINEAHRAWTPGVNHGEAHAIRYRAMVAAAKEGER